MLLASGRAILASVPDNGTAARAVQQSGGGVIVPPEDSQALATAILDLYQNQEKVKTLGENSRKYAIEKYSFEQALNQYEQLCDSLTGKAKAINSESVI